MPTALYPRVVAAIFDAVVDIHYLSNITGHGWRKLMRARRELSYVVERIPEPSPLFRVLIERGRLESVEAYGHLNMGAGFAVFCAAEHAALAVETARAGGVEAWEWGRVQEGAREVVIEPLAVRFAGRSLEVRA